MAKILYLFLIISVPGLGQTTTPDLRSSGTKDTTIFFAKEHLPGYLFFSAYDNDTPGLSRMIIYDGPEFYRNYTSGIYYFSGFSLLIYLFQHNLNQQYLNILEHSLKLDLDNDSNLVLIQSTASSEIKQIAFITKFMLSSVK